MEIVNEDRKSVEVEPLEEAVTLHKLQEALQGLMTVDSVRVLVNGARPAVEFGGQLGGGDSEALFNQILERLTGLGYTPFLTEREGQHWLQVIPEVADTRTGNPWVNIGLFALTLVSVVFVGAASQLQSATDPLDWAAGIPFAAAILSILSVHELSHYFVGRRYGSPVSLPYFLPLPVSPLGTMGAVILQRAPMRSRRSLFDIGVAGPLGGLMVALPLLVVGLKLSRVEPIVPGLGYTLEGNSLLYFLVKLIIFGRPLPSGGVDVMIHPVAFAAWAGLLVTGINLFPIGQLDGGHVAYALWGRTAWKVARVFVYAAFIWGGILSLLGNGAGLSWFIWGGLGWLMGIQHPAPLNDVTPLDPKRRILGLLVVGIFILVLVPIPFMTL